MLVSQNLLTVEEISSKLGCPYYRISYLIKSRKIEPIQRIGTVRLFSPEQFDFISDEFTRINMPVEVPNVAL
jgi:hypothetical protein